MLILVSVIMLFDIFIMKLIRRDGNDVPAMTNN